MDFIQHVTDTISQWDKDNQVSGDLQLIQYVIRRAIKHAFNMLRSRNSYWYVFEGTVNSHPKNRALVFAKPTGLPGDAGFEIQEWTFQELYDQILRLSHILVHTYGVTEDDTIAIDCTNKPLFILLWFACWNIGATPAFLNFNNQGTPLVHCIKVANIKKVFIDPECAHIVKGSEEQIYTAIPDVQLNYLNEDFLLKEIKDPNALKFRQLDSKRRAEDHDYNTAALIYTSGTTGLPKSAIMSWRKAVFGTALYAYIVKLGSNETVFTSMPLYHSTASVLGICSAWNRGACVALSTKFSTSTIWTQVKLTKSTHLQYVGEVCRYLLNSKPHPDERNHCLRVAYGNGLRNDIWKEFKDRFNIPAIGEFYAATESPLALTSFQEGDFGIGACRNYGKLIQMILQFQQTLIKMDPEDNSVEWRDPVTGLCKVAPVGEPGELLMNIFIPKRPETMFQGYLGNKKETNSKILRDVFRKGDAWFRSGDLLKSDEYGLWYFVDRLGDTFRWKSENVSATEVEAQLTKVPGVSEVVVVGVKVPNHEGRAGFAVIETKENVAQQEVLDNLLQSIELPRYAVPIFIKFVKEIIHSDNHKTLKRSYREQVLPKGSSGDEVLYWLKNGHYEELTLSDWNVICAGKAKL
ncbi:CYFA0S08e03752g1_1 [Cyberlindnera fabianii]|uniref:Very long-chain fatty acid transport protein n=1 Tax=Cyberlindnera fabianii TaxID=36022 RepID=A0A061AWT4_CYBFA|nr:CYFA0S08e03752g1_1 [Cyberlindnera fabianii]